MFARTARRVALLAVPLIAGLLGTAAPARAATSVTTTASLTCGGQSVDSTAKIRYRTERLIKAPLDVVWRVQTDVARWPAWQEPVSSARRLDHGPLRAGSRFRWTTPVPETPVTPATTLVITSTVQQLQRDKCIRWTGPAIGDGLRIDRGVHVWTFTKVPGGVLVRTEETHAGKQIETDVPLATEFLGQGLEAWLTALKTTAETRCLPA
ncbi:SRPBCC family protein [Actinokineospora enzanensis]|uniref:SRPBCC family protein n=1 Tax=Actinokineospora enzanensis TaxID=155975 RepID=UPI0003633406|nr:SRPBCC family protein [Actinokineospora enzanensis]